MSKKVFAVLFTLTFLHTTDGALCGTCSTCTYYHPLRKCIMMVENEDYYTFRKRHEPCRMSSTYGQSNLTYHTGDVTDSGYRNFIRDFMQLKMVERLLVIDQSNNLIVNRDYENRYVCRDYRDSSLLILTATSWESPCPKDFVFKGRTLCDAKVINGTQELPSCPFNLRYQANEDGKWMTVYWRPGINGGINQTFTVKIEKIGADRLLQHQPVYQGVVEQNVWYGEISHNITMVILEPQQLYTVTVEAANSLGPAADCKNNKINLTKEEALSTATTVSYNTSLMDELTHNSENDTVTVLGVFLALALASVAILVVLYTRSLGRCASCKINWIKRENTGGGISVRSMKKILFPETKKMKGKKDVGEQRGTKGQGEINVADDGGERIYENVEPEKTYDEVLDISVDTDRHYYMAGNFK